MTRKGEAHETLSLVFQRDGVPPTMIFDGSKEQTTADFKRSSEKLIVMAVRLNLIPRGSKPPRDVSVN
jgi:hypothetical protein